MQEANVSLTMDLVEHDFVAQFDLHSSALSCCSSQVCLADRAVSGALGQICVHFGISSSSFHFLLSESHRLIEKLWNLVLYSPDE